VSSRNLFHPAVREDPYPFYRTLREEAPVVRVEPLGAWLVTRYAEVAEVLRSPQLYSSEAMMGALMIGRTRTEDDEGPPPMVITTDPPKHDRLRGLVNRGFTPRRIGELEPRVRQIVAEIIADLDQRDEIDLVNDFAVPFPLRVIAELLGVEPDRFEDFKRWSQAALARFGQVQSAEDSERADAAMDEMSAYLEERVEERRARPTGDLLSVLVSKEEEDALTLHEVIGFAVLLLVAGNETTTNLIGCTVLELQDHPEQLARVERDPAQIPALVEEGLRYTSPVQLLFRQLREDTILGGVPLQAGDIVLPCYAAANRDPRQFEDPEVFDIGRESRPHLAFGLGIHFCLGAGLARLEARVAFEALVPRLRRWKRTGAPIEWSSSPFLRGPASLPVVRSLQEARGVA
jgi:cytochrome P450